MDADTPEKVYPNETEPSRVLVVDDSRADCRFVCNEVRRLLPKLQVKGVSQAAEFSEALDQERMDICLFDYHLGWDNGIHVAQLARNRWPDCRVILVTAAATDQVIAQVARHERYIDDFLRKEEHPYRLEFALNAALDRRLVAKRLRAYEREHGALAELVNASVRARDLGEFFAQVVGITARATGAARCRIVALGADGRSLRIMADSAEDASDDCADLNLLISLAAPAAHDGEARPNAAAALSPKIISVLLMDALRPYGFLVVDQAENRPVGDVDLHFLKVTGGIIELIFNRRIQPSDSTPKENFLRSISHEIRTPLNGIVGGCEVVAQLLEGDEAQTVNPMLRLIEQSCERLVYTVDALIKLSVLQNGSYQPRRERIDLSSLVTHTVNRMFVRAQAKGLTLTFVDQTPGVTVCADRESLEGAYHAILDNAVKFTESGSITIRLASVEGRVCVEFKDTGIGISAEYLPRLFEPFSQQDTTTNRPYEGLGLGLALAKRYLDLNGVEIRVNSTPQAGATFLTLFPATPD